MANGEPPIGIPWETFQKYAKITSPLMEGVIIMSNKPVYDTLDCMRLIKKKYPLIPICIIRRILFAEELYMHKIGIIDWIPKLDHWYFKK